MYRAAGTDRFGFVYRVASFWEEQSGVSVSTRSVLFPCFVLLVERWCVVKHWEGVQVPGKGSKPGTCTISEVVDFDCRYWRGFHLRFIEFRCSVAFACFSEFVMFHGDFRSI